MKAVALKTLLEERDGGCEARNMPWKSHQPGGLPAGDYDDELKKVYTIMSTKNILKQQ